RLQNPLPALRVVWSTGHTLFLFHLKCLRLNRIIEVNKKAFLSKQPGCTNVHNLATVVCISSLSGIYG
ncbi:hypothetical protein, partial [Klebsiella michiganensis]